MVVGNVASESNAFWCCGFLPILFIHKLDAHVYAINMSILSFSWTMLSASRRITYIWLKWTNNTGRERLCRIQNTWWHEAMDSNAVSLSRTSSTRLWIQRFDLGTPMCVRRVNVDPKLWTKWDNKADSSCRTVIHTEHEQTMRLCREAKAGRKCASRQFSVDIFPIQKPSIEVLVSFCWNGFGPFVIWSVCVSPANRIYRFICDAHLLSASQNHCLLQKPDQNFNWVPRNYIKLN